MPMRPAPWMVRTTALVVARTAVLGLLLGLSGCEKINKFITSRNGAAGGESSEGTEEPAPQAGPRLDCRDEGKLEVSLPLRNLGKRLNAQQIIVLDPFEEARVPFEGALLESLLDNVYGRRWRLKASLRLGMVGGQQTQIAVADITKYKAWLAWRRMDRPEFAVERRSAAGQLLQLAPLYLVWDSDADAAIRARGTWGWLPAVLSLDLSSSVGNPTALKPGPGTSEATLRGYAEYTTFCANCHTLYGVGGLGGPELGSPVPVSRWIGREWLRRWIDKPTAMRDRASMPPLPADIPDRARTIDDIVSFLDYAGEHPLAASATPTAAPTPSSAEP